MKVSIPIIACIVVLASVTGTAHAQSASQLISAEALFDEGRALAKEGKYTEACSKFAESQKLGPAVGTLLNLGDCYEKAGRLASAWLSFREAAALASQSGQDERAEYASKRLATVAERVPRLRIFFPAPAARPSGLEIRRGDDVLGEAESGVAVPVDPGTIVVAATAPGKQPWSKAVPVAVSETQSVEIPPLLDAATPPRENATTTSESSTQRTVALVVGGLGIVGLVVGTATGLAAKSKNDEAQTHCRAEGCTRLGIDMIDDAQSLATGSTIAFVAGGACLAGGAILWLTAPRGIGVRTTAGPTSARLEIGGVW